MKMETATITAIIAATASVVVAFIGVAFGKKGKTPENPISKEKRRQHVIIKSTARIAISEPNDEIVASITRNDIKHAAKTISELVKKLNKEKYSSECVSAIETTMYELMRNAFDYGCLSDLDEIEVWILVNEVTTTAQISNAKNALFAIDEEGMPITPQKPSRHAISGRGLYFCKELADWVHLINQSDRGIVEVGFFKQRVLIESQIIEENIRHIKVSANPLSPSLLPRAQTAIDAELKRGNLVVVSFVGRNFELTNVSHPVYAHDHSIFNSNFGNAIVKLYHQNPHAEDSVIRVVLLGPAIFTSLFPEFSYAENIIDAVKILTNVSRITTVRSNK